jgi:hypothetical protein
VTTGAIQIQQLDSFPVAVIRRQVKLSELSRVVPECCGLVFAAARGQQARVGRHIAIYWDPSICVEAGVELHGTFVTQGSIVLSATPAGRIVSATHWGPYQDLGTAHQSIVVGRNRPANAWLVPTGRFTGTGSRRGMPNPLRSVRIFTTSSVRLETL